MDDMTSDESGGSGGDVKIRCDEVDATENRVKRREDAKNIVTSMA
jgi:hypothetical protein